MSKKEKFQDFDLVKTPEGEGTILETVKNNNGSYQHRVRVDMVDHWLPASKIELISRVEVEPETPVADDDENEEPVIPSIS